MTSHTHCVLREVAPGDTTYVPAADIISRMGALTAGEQIFVGSFSGRVEKFGPSGSDSRTVCTPAGRMTTIIATGAERLLN